MARMKVTDLLKTMDIFESLPQQDLDQIAKLLREKKFNEGQLLFRQGEPGDAMYIVLSGRVKLWTSDAMGREKVLAFFGEGDFFGETAVLMGEARTASAEAASPTKVLLLRKDDFDQLLAWNVTVMREMLKIVAQRQAAANQRLVQEAAAERAGVGAGKIFAIFSPRGGAGKSMLAVNLGVALAQQQPDRVAVVDLDLIFGHTSLMLNLNPKSSLASVSPGALRQLDRDSLNYYLTTHDSSLRLLVGASRPEEGEAVSGDHVKAVLDAMKRMFSVILVDTVRNFSEPTLAALELSDQIVMLATPDASAVRDLRECQRIFLEVLQFSPQRFYWVLNQPFPYKSMSREQLEGELGLSFSAELSYAADGPTQATLLGVPYISQHPGAAVSRTIERIGKEIQQRAIELQVSLGYAGSQSSAGATISG